MAEYESENFQTRGNYNYMNDKLNKFTSYYSTYKTMQLEDQEGLYEDLLKVFKF